MLCMLLSVTALAVAARGESLVRAALWSGRVGAADLRSRSASLYRCYFRSNLR